MLKKRIIPCLDINKGRVVKGINFVDLIDAGDPAEQAKIYNDSGADEICFLDITASNENRDTIIEIVKKTANKLSVPLTVGGGVRKIEDIPPPTVKGMKTSSAVFLTKSIIVFLFSIEALISRKQISSAPF